MPMPMQMPMPMPPMPLPNGEQQTVQNEDDSNFFGPGSNDPRVEPVKTLSNASPASPALPALAKVPSAREAVNGPTEPIKAAAPKP